MIKREGQEVFIIYYVAKIYDDLMGEYNQEDVSEIFGSKEALLDFIANKVGTNDPVKVEDIFGLNRAFGKPVLTKYELQFDVSNMKFSLKEVTSK
jgi:hypothetical protein